MKVYPGTWKKAVGQFLGNECSPTAGNGCMQRFVNSQISTLAGVYKLPRLLTLDAHFVSPDKKILQDILLQNGNKDGWRFYTSYHQMDTEQAYEAWQKNHATLSVLSDSVFAEGVENNQVLSDMVEVIKLPKQYHLPQSEIPKPIREDVTLETDDAKLLRKIMTKVLTYGRLPTDERRPVYLARLMKEIKVIANNPAPPPASIDRALTDQRGFFRTNTASHGTDGFFGAVLVKKRD